MKRLSKEAEDRAVRFLRDAERMNRRYGTPGEFIEVGRNHGAPQYERRDGKTFNEEQARRDIRAFPELLMTAFARAERDGRLTIERLLADTVAELYLEHTGKGPSRTGRFPALTALLADDLGIPFDRRKLAEQCREAKRAKKGDLSVLKSHVVRYDEDGDPVCGGYEPARDNTDARIRFAAYLASLKT
jgi:hypothetical protein